MKITKPGIYLDVPSEVYFADPCPKPSLTQSIAKLIIERSALHAACAHPRITPPIAVEDDEPEKYDAAKAIGNAAHALMIGRGKDIEVVDTPDWRKADAKAAKAAALEAGRVPILKKHNARAVAMVEAARRQLRAAGCGEAFSDAGEGEVVIAWEEDGLWFRSMIDWFERPTLFYDFKTSGMSVAPHALPMMMVNAGWDVQAAMHERGLDRLDPDGRGRRKFRFVAQENDEPYALTVCELSEAVLTMGRKKLDYAINVWRACMRTNRWPAYPAEILRPEYPSFKESQWLDREQEHADRTTRSENNPELINAG